MAGKYRLGIDVGGTFTDAMIINEETGEIRIGKVPSTPKDPSIGFLDAVDTILKENNIEAQDVTYVVHGTTVATNAIIEGKMAATGFITTEGFRDMLEIQRQIRPSLYDLQFEKPQPLVPRYLCFGIPERMDFQGNILTKLDTDSVRDVARQLKKEGVESIAVCYLHAYINNEHEARTEALLKEEFPEAIISLSSEVAPEFREYLRASTTVINAAVRPIVSRYLTSIESRLKAAGLSAELLVMQSNGGVLTFGAASEKPVFMVESGPAAGVIAASYLGNTLGSPNVLSFDMGGTTAKTGLVRKGTPTITKDYEVGVAAGGTGTGVQGAGYPIRTPVIDLVEIGAGGGSIAWVDSGGILRVGPQSAGADPGPVCYGRGGEEPTITDANLVLGRLDPEYFLGGKMKLDVEGARKAIESKCAKPLGLDLLEVALGIVEIANTAMVNALRRISVQRGYDPREFMLVAFGGAGPVHANRLADQLEIPRTLIPMSPGITSATGLLVTDLKHDYSNTLIQPIDELDLSAIENTYVGMETQGRTALSNEGMEENSIRFIRQVDVRYIGQSYELGIVVEPGKFDGVRRDQILEEFHKEHERAYGFSAPGEPVEIVAIRLTAVGDIAKPTLREIGKTSGGVDSARRTTRSVYFAESKGFVDCPVYDRYKLSSGDVLQGPAIIEEMDSTTIIHPEYKGDVDRYGNIFLSGV
ncbi:MAG: hypothetical protein CL896_01175 [Dehalococcoidia bacterium]|nr:hypothetical protein [Dehalococcoidia bacterium]